MFVNQDGYYLAYEVRIVNSIPRMQDIYPSVLPRDINVLETSVFNSQIDNCLCLLILLWDMEGDRLHNHNLAAKPARTQGISFWILYVHLH
jgi:hypothetical protein